MDTNNIEITGELKLSENVPAGIIGAILCGLVGVVLYVVLSVLGYIAGISGFVAFIAAYFGYKKLAGVESSVTGIIVAVIITLVYLVVGEYLSLGWIIYDSYKSAEMSVSLIDSFKQIPDALANEEMKQAVIKDLAIGLFLTVIATASQVKNAFGSARRASKEGK